VLLFLAYCWLDYLDAKKIQTRLQDNLKILQEETSKVLHLWVKERILQVELQAETAEMSALVRPL